MSIARARTIRSTAAAAALLAAGIATSASAEQARGLTNSNIAAASSSAATASAAQRRAVADPIICVRDQRVMSRITQDFCRTSSEWERRGGLLPERY